MTFAKEIGKIEAIAESFEQKSAALMQKMEEIEAIADERGMTRERRERVFEICCDAGILDRAVSILYEAIDVLCGAV